MAISQKFSNFAEYMELTNAIIKKIKSLDQLKTRREEGIFKVEGTKAVTDTLGSFPLFMLVATDGWIQQNREAASVARQALCKAHSRDLERMSSLSTHPDVIAVYRIPVNPGTDFVNLAADNLLLALDTIQDPGNLGTIIRTADWFGIRHILCNHGTADCFSPKVVQSTMGAISRVQLHYCDLAAQLGAIAASGAPVYGTFLDGDNMYQTKLTPNGVIVIGNEGNGISPDVSRQVTHRLLIPSYPAGEPTSESLNAAVAASIIMARFRQPL